MEAVDHAIEKNDDGVYDLVIDSGDIKPVFGFDTSITLSVLEERRADSSEQPVEHLRRGWVGNTLNEDGFQNGSKLWLLYQARTTQNNLNLSERYVQEGLQWFVDDGYLDAVTVESFLEHRTFRIRIRLVRFNGAVETREFDLWENTFANI